MMDRRSKTTFYKTKRIRADLEIAKKEGFVKMNDDIAKRYKEAATKEEKQSIADDCIRINNGLINKRAGKSFRATQRDLYGDYHSFISMMVVKALDSYDPKFGVPFSAYLANYLGYGRFHWEKSRYTEDLKDKAMRSPFFVSRLSDAETCKKPYTSADFQVDMMLRDKHQNLEPNSVDPKFGHDPIEMMRSMCLREDQITVISAILGGSNFQQAAFLLGPTTKRQWAQKLYKDGLDSMRRWIMNSRFSLKLPKCQELSIIDRWN